MRYKAEIFASAVVAVGDFNPAIFSPDWLERNGLIGKDDADNAREKNSNKSLLISHQVAAFETEWFALQVLENQFSLTSKDALSPALRDLATGIFQMVPHTPIIAVGLNFMGHFKLPNEDTYHKVGDVLAPKDIWQSLYPDLSHGLADLTVRIQYAGRGEPITKKDERRITVQPSNKLKFGVYLAYNDHHDVTVANTNELSSAERVAIVIDTEWENSWKDAVRVFDGILSKAIGK